MGSLEGLLRPEGGSTLVLGGTCGMLYWLVNREGFDARRDPPLCRGPRARCRRWASVREEDQAHAVLGPLPARRGRVARDGRVLHRNRRAHRRRPASHDRELLGDGLAG